VTQPDEARLEQLFRALADPTRRRILDLLADRGACTVSELAAAFPDLVRSGISKHLMLLREVGAVTAEKRGRERYYTIDPGTMQAVLRPWVARYERFWDDRLAALKRAAEAEAGKGDA
jgi:DNA-binding transcriptional ArsR family regulator